MPNESTFNRRVIEYKLDHKESHLKILSDLDLKEETLEKLRDVYRQVEEQISREPLFQTSYSPIKVKNNTSGIISRMLDASIKADVGPMAAIAGTVAESIGKFLLDKGAREVIVENGGDIFVRIEEEKEVGVHAGNSPWSNRIVLKIKPGETPLGICTSSSTVGHSINLGEVDAVTVVARSTALADAAATAIGNHVKGKKGVEKAIQFGEKIGGINGFLIIKGETLAVWGKIPELVKKEFDVER